jgi:hypothetical protein
MKVPFGLHKASDRFVDIADVENGKKCGCKCPSCELNLIARQGAVTDWHFAHDTSNDVDNKYEECEFSYHESVRLMLRNLIVEGNKLAVPDFPLTNFETNQTVLVTKQQTITYEQSVLDVTEPNIKGFLDVVTMVSGKRLGLFISHEGRKLVTVENGIYDLVGLIELNIQHVQLRQSNMSSRECLRLWIETQPSNKKWIFHARQEKARKHLSMMEENSVGLMTDNELMKYCLKKTRKIFLDEKNIDPDLPGWRGFVTLDADKLFKKLREQSVKHLSL